jgi:hypothetical protein
MAYLARYGELPTSVLWNATKAYQKGPEAWVRYASGWAPEDQPEDWRKWPHPSAIAQTFEGGMAAFQQLVQREFAKRAHHGIPYRAVPVPPERLALAETEAVMRSGWGPNKHDVRPPGLHPGELDVQPAPSPVALRPLAVGRTINGPFGFPPCDERGTVGIVGKRGCGKTSMLWRLALNDVLETRARVVVLERGEATITTLLEATLEEPVDGDCASLGQRTPGGGYEMSPLTVVSDDASIRARALMLIAQSARRERTGPLSLICDDGQDLLPVILKVLSPCPRCVHLSVAWTPLGTSDDLAMVRRSSSLCGFAQQSIGMATVVANELNRRG